MKQITFSKSQWDLLLAALTRVKVHAYNQWTDWKDNQMSILLAGMDESAYQDTKNRRFEKYRELSELTQFMRYNVRDIEEDKA